MKYSVLMVLNDGNEFELKNVEQENLDCMAKCYENRWVFYGCGVSIRMDDVKFFRYKAVE